MSPVCADLPVSAWAEQQDSGLLHVILRPRCWGIGKSGLLTTRRPGCTPCRQIQVSEMLCLLQSLHIRVEHTIRLVGLREFPSIIQGMRRVYMGQFYMRLYISTSEQGMEACSRVSRHEAMPMSCSIPQREG